MDKLWLVKNKKGRIYGPYSEQEICFYIEEGEFKGEELFSPYPAGKWKPLSAHPVFYEKVLEQYNKNTRSHKKSKKPETHSNLHNNTKDPDDYLEPTRIVAPRDETREETPLKDKSKVKIKLSKDFKEDVFYEERGEDIIDMQDSHKSLSLKLKSSLKLPLLALVAVLLLFAFVFLKPEDGQKTEKTIRLLPLNGRQLNTLTDKDKAVILKQGLAFYHTGTLSNYLKAQNRFVRVLQGSPKSSNQEAYLYLCLVYLELWPFSHQDNKDKEALKKVLHLTSKEDKGGIYSGLCQGVDSLINKKPSQTLLIVQSSLHILKNQNQVFFYYLKAKALQQLNKISEAENYLQTIFKLRPQWVEPYMLSAQMFYQNQQYDLAGKLYQKVLSLYPKHISANLSLGILEYKYFKKINNSEKRLRPLLANLKDLIEPDILLEAYIVLANIYLQQNNKKAVLQYSNKAYALDPEHPDVVLLKSKLGDKANFKNIQVKARGLIYKGDMLVSQGDCARAKNYFEKAYKVGESLNALAAYKTAKCYWQSGASGQAIRWLKRSISADSKMQSAYFLLSDYLSTLYDFDSAREVLNAVKKNNPSSYDLFKAYALLSLRQNQYQATVAYAERALKFYSFDIDLYVLLSKAYLALGKSNKSFFYAEKAVKENVNSVPAQISYALALGLAYGSHKAENYLKKMIGHFPLIEDYPQALGEYYFNKGMYDQALEIFLNLIAKNPKFKPSYVYLGRIYSHLALKSGSSSQEKYQQALKYLLEASLLDISDPEPVFYIGQTHFEHKQYQLAENEFEKILRINSNYPLIHYYIGLVNFYQQGKDNLDKALKVAKVQMAKSPNHYLPYKLAGDIYRLKAQGVFEDPQEKRTISELCAKEYQKALKYIKNNIEISIGLIGCYKGAGNLDSALQLALQFVEEEGMSGYPELYKELGSIYEAKELYEQARAKYVDYFRLKPNAKERSAIESRINKLISEKTDLSRALSGEE